MKLKCELRILCLSPELSTNASDAHVRAKIRIVTVDDMSCDSIGVFGCKLPGATPHAGRLTS